MAATTPLSPVKILRLRDLFQNPLECEEALSDSLGSGLTPDIPVDWLEPGVWDQSTPQVSQRPIDISLGSVYTDYTLVPYPYRDYRDARFRKVNWRLTAALLKSYGTPCGLLGVDTVPKGYRQVGMNPFQYLVRQLANHSSPLHQTPADQIYFLREAIRGFISAADLTRPMEQHIEEWTPLDFVLDWTTTATESSSLMKTLLHENTITKIPDCCSIPIQIFFSGIYSILNNKNRKGELLPKAQEVIQDCLAFPLPLIRIISIYAFGFEAIAKYLRRKVNDPAWNMRFNEFGQSIPDKGSLQEYYPNFIPNAFSLLELCNEADQNRAKYNAQTESKTAADIPALQQKLFQRVFLCDQESRCVAEDAQSIYTSITPAEHVDITDIGRWGGQQLTQFVPRFNQCRTQLFEVILPVLKREFPNREASQSAVESFTLNPRNSKEWSASEKLGNFVQRVCELEDVQKRLQDIIAINQRLKLLAAAPTGESEHKEQKESKEKEESKRAPSAHQGALTFMAPGAGGGAGAPTGALASALAPALAANPARTEASASTPVTPGVVEALTPAPAAAAAAPRKT